MKKDKIKEKILEMIKDIAGTNDLIEARAECLYSGHLFEKHLAPSLKLSPEQMANLAFSLGRSSQLGILFGVLWHTQNMDDIIEVEARILYSNALKYGEAKWRKKSSQTQVDSDESIA